jgi:hypothetical protein
VTLLLWAVATDRPEPRIVRLLPAHGANISVRFTPAVRFSPWDAF